MPTHRLRLALAVATAFALAHCGGPTTPLDGSTSDAPVVDRPAPTDNPSPSDGPAPDVIDMDAPAPMDVPTPSDTPTSSDSPTSTDTPVPSDGAAPMCGTARPDVTAIVGTEGLVIARDGTIYYSQNGAVGRMRPGMAPENRWAVLTGATTVWGLALDPTNNHLYAGAPSGSIYHVDTTTATPAVTRYPFAAGQANGLTADATGVLYYSDFSGNQVYRVDPATMMRTRVTTMPIAGANGVAFGRDGSLYVLSYGTGVLYRLTLTAGMESARAMVASGLGSPDGIAFDATGRIYVTDNAGRRLIRLNADGTAPMVLRMGISAAANVEFGAGPLNCRDIYVASSGPLVQFTMGDQPGAAVPWH